MELVEIRKLVKAEVVFTVAQLAAWMKRPVHAARRQLKKWGALTSYNANASYYVLPELVDFNDHGIWRHGPAAFSSHGNLTSTVEALVKGSVAGLTSREIGEILSLEPRSFLSNCRKHAQIVCERDGKTFVYLCAEPQRQKEQRKARLPATVLNDHDAVVVLLCWIQDPGQTIEELVAAVRQRAPSASVESVTEFFRMHGLSPEKKGALRSQR